MKIAFTLMSILGTAAMACAIAAVWTGMHEWGITGAILLLAAILVIMAPVP